MKEFSPWTSVRVNTMILMTYGYYGFPTQEDKDIYLAYARSCVPRGYPPVSPEKFFSNSSPDSLLEQIISVYNSAREPLLQQNHCLLRFKEQAQQERDEALKAYKTLWDWVMVGATEGEYWRKAWVACDEARLKLRNANQEFDDINTKISGENQKLNLEVDRLSKEVQELKSELAKAKTQASKCFYKPMRQGVGNCTIRNTEALLKNPYRVEREFTMHYGTREWRDYLLNEDDIKNAVCRDIQANLETYLRPKQIGDTAMMLQVSLKQIAQALGFSFNYQGSLEGILGNILNRVNAQSAQIAELAKNRDSWLKAHQDEVKKNEEERKKAKCTIDRLERENLWLKDFEDAFNVVFNFCKKLGVQHLGPLPRKAADHMVAFIQGLQDKTKLPEAKTPEVPSVTVGQIVEVRMPNSWEVVRVCYRGEGMFGFLDHSSLSVTYRYLNDLGVTWRF